MKTILQIVLFLLATTAPAQNNLSEWEALATLDPSMSPEYGNIEKTPEQKEADKSFVDQLLAESNGDRELAAKKMTDLGFRYVYQEADLISAMRRFNQAFLIDPVNAEVYYGYGTVYFILGALEETREQFDKGLQINPEHARMLTDYGITYLEEYLAAAGANASNTEVILDKGIELLKKSHKADPDYPGSSYMLSVLYMLKEDCGNARKFLKLTEALDSSIITQEFLNELNTSCKVENLDCSTIRTGKFRIEDEASGVTLITRTEDFQIEENEERNFKLKMTVTWLDECTYQLKPVEDLANPEAELPSLVLTCHVTEVADGYYQQVSESDIDDLKLARKVEILE